MRTLRRFFTHWQNWLGLALVLFFVGVAFAAPLISPEDERNPGPFQRDDSFRFSDISPKTPAEAPPLGTLPGQLKVSHALVWGTRGALEFGLKVALSAALFGVLYGAIAAYAGGWLNGLMMRVADAFLAFPVIAGVVLLQQLWLVTFNLAGGYIVNGTVLFDATGEPSLIQHLIAWIDPLTLTLILFSWMPYARLTSTMVATLKQTEFIQAGRALGASPARIILRHLLPNAISPAVVLAARDVGSMVILQATFTFVGLSGGSVWGQMLVIGRDWIIGPGGNIFHFWWTFLPATLALVFFGIGWNLLGDGVNDLLDPHGR
jgi:peptide/nickel transport system permease protein